MNCSKPYPDPDRQEPARSRIILVCSSFWAGLVDWFRTRLIDEKMIDPTDMELIQGDRRPARVVEAIFKHYEARPLAPLPNEREMMLNL